MNDDDRGAAALLLRLEGEGDCPVCGLGNAFPSARQYDVCARCGWVDDPADIVHPDEKSETNDYAVREDEIGGRDFVVDGAMLRDVFRGARGLKASIGPCPAVGEWPAALRAGSAQTPTGRSRLSVCPLCGGDDYEISLTADVRVSEDGVVWSRIGLESYDYQPEGWELNLRSGPAGFAFDAREYQRALVNGEPDEERRRLQRGA